MAGDQSRSRVQVPATRPGGDEASPRTGVSLGGLILERDLGSNPPSRGVEQRLFRDLAGDPRAENLYFDWSSDLCACGYVCVRDRPFHRVAEPSLRTPP